MIDFTEFSNKASPIGLLGVMVTPQSGQTESWFAEPDIRRNIYSASKSFTSLAVGFAVQEGLISLDELLVDAFEQDIPENPDENLQRARIRDLLTMCLGQEHAELMGRQRPLYEEEDWVKMSLARPFTNRPGSCFLYNNVGPYLAGILVQRRSGCNLVDYMTPRLFQTLGIRRPIWEVDPMGYTFGAGGLFLSLRELHRFGQFCLAGGVWNGHQLLSRAYLNEATSKQVDNGQYGYGYLFWRGMDNSYRADGKYSQYSIVLPDRHAVISTACECRRPDEMLELIHRCLVPQLS